MSPRPALRALPAVLVALAGCVQRTVPLRPPAIPTPAHVAVLPFRVEAAAGDHPDLAPVPDDTGASAACTLAARLAAEGVAVIDADATLQAASATGGRSSDAELARAVADKVGANVTVLGTIRRYVEREGSGLGVTVPASVAYEIVVLRAADGVVLGSDRFAYTQAPLNENLLDLPRFLEGGGRWRTRAEILDGALRQSAHRLAAWLVGPKPRTGGPSGG